jgi:hypothetical protein
MYVKFECGSFLTALVSYQLINVPTAGAQPFNMDLTQEERVIAPHVGPVLFGGS